MFPAFSALLGFIIGAAVGSFLNVVIYRMPRAISLSNPRHSFCPNCKHQLYSVDLIPLLSWLSTRGKCRYCHAKVSSRYFFVEVITGAIWGGLWYQFMVVQDDPTRMVAYCLMASALVAIVYIDSVHFIIPDQINAFLLFLGIGLNIALFAENDPLARSHGLPSSVVGALFGFGVLWGIALLGRLLFGKDAMGHGDIKMARGLGAILLPLVAGMSFAIAIALGAVLGIAQILLRKASSSGSEEGDNAEEPEEAYEPETIGSLFKCGFGYLFCIDVIGLFIPKLYISWFGEDPYEPIVNEDAPDFPTEPTMIPFGPYLAVGAIIAAMFQVPLVHAFEAYWRMSGGGPALLEHSIGSFRL